MSLPQRSCWAADVVHGDVTCDGDSGQVMAGHRIQYRCNIDHDAQVCSWAAAAELIFGETGNERAGT